MEAERSEQAPPHRSGDILGALVGYLMLSVIPFLILWYLLFIALAPGAFYCCQSGPSQQATWEAAVNRFFEANVWLTIVPILGLTGLGLLRLVQQCKETGEKGALTAVMGLAPLATLVIIASLFLNFHDFFAQFTSVRPTPGLLRDFEPLETSMFTKLLFIGLPLLVLTIFYISYPWFIGALRLHTQRVRG